MVPDEARAIDRDEILRVELPLAAPEPREREVLIQVQSEDGSE